MQGLFSKVSVLAAVFVMSSAQAAGNAGDVASGESIYLNGKGDVPACNSCHGQDAMGDDAMGTPRLAGQSFAYIAKQLKDFADDKRMDTVMYVMNVNAKGMSDQDMMDVAAYVESLDYDTLASSDMNQVKELGNPVGVRYLGKSIAQYGAAERGISACHSCHSYNGRGMPPIYPMIGGQKYVYLVNQLKQFRDGSRANDDMGQMRAVAKNMSDEDIYNVATFLTSAPRTTMGNSRWPENKPH
ncbi:MAG TPA: c-type cytochrome [Gammaproteobacteria bacterium]|nr:c-type cytochrome [Gammaproteobacteria bacterium]